MYTCKYRVEPRIEFEVSVCIPPWLRRSYLYRGNDNFCKKPNYAQNIYLLSVVTIIRYYEYFFGKKNFSRSQSLQLFSLVLSGLLEHP